MQAIRETKASTCYQKVICGLFDRTNSRSNHDRRRSGRSRAMTRTVAGLEPTLRNDQHVAWLDWRIGGDVTVFEKAVEVNRNLSVLAGHAAHEHGAIAG